MYFTERRSAAFPMKTLFAFPTKIRKYTNNGKIILIKSINNVGIR